jgi:hypothetical protein
MGPLGGGVCPRGGYRCELGGVDCGSELEGGAIKKLKTKKGSELGDVDELEGVSYCSMCVCLCVCVCVHVCTHVVCVCVCAYMYAL